MRGPAFWILLGVIAVAAFLIGKGCGDPRPVTNQRYVDSLIIENGLTAARLSYFVDSATTESIRQDSIIRGAIDQRDSLKTEARKSAQNASYWVGMYRAAKGERDTIVQLAACDSLADEVQVAWATVERERRAADSVITAQQDRIDLADKLRDKLRDRIATQDTLISRLYKASTDANDQVKRLDRKQRRMKFWSGVKTAGAAVAGFFIGFKVVK